MVKRIRRTSGAMPKTKTKTKTKDESVRVSLAARSYKVQIGSGALDRLGEYLSQAPSKRAFMISDRQLTSHRSRVRETLKHAGWDVHEVAVEAGESLKELDQLYPIYGEMLKARIDRSSTLIALGGGSIGDAAGFVASTYLRGIRWVGLPTTLLAQVDSSVGGKTAVNHPSGKNLIGTFHQPSLVVCETEFLKTLSQREMISGLGEVVKYGLTFDAKFFEYVKENWAKARDFDPDVLRKMIKVSIGWKAKAVARDEFDRTGIREVLNFGHTFGHALESVTRYQGFQHGEAIIWGMRFAAALSHQRRKLSRRNFLEIDSFLRQLPVPPLPEGVKADSYFKPMVHDKKSHEGKVRFVLLKGIGESVSDRNVTEDDLHKAYELMTPAR